MSDPDSNPEVVFDSKEEPAENTSDTASTSTTNPQKVKKTKKKKPKEDKTPKQPVTPPPETKVPPTPPPKPQKKMAIVGILQPFNSSTDDFEDWEVTYKSFLIANGLDMTNDEAKCQGIFLASIGIQNCALLKNLVAPTKLEDSTIKTLLKQMKSYYKPTPKALAERYKFMCRQQQTGENANQFLAALRTLARHCKFTSDLDNRLRDQFIFGLHNSRAQRAMFEKDDSLTLDEALKIVVAMETAERSTDIIRRSSQTSNNEASVNKTGSNFKSFRSQKLQHFDNKRQFNEQQSGKPEQQSSCKQQNTATVSNNKSNNNCKRCGSPKHGSHNCPHKDAQCFKCKKTGHFANVCLSKQKATTNNIDTIEHVDSVNRVVSADDKIFVQVKINNKLHKMEFDTGCKTSILSAVFWKQELDSASLVSSTVMFKPYKGPKFSPVGNLNCMMEYNGQKLNHSIPVVNGDSLFGRDLIKLFKFNWNCLSSNNSVETMQQQQPQSVDSLMKEFSDVFTAPMPNERIKNYKAKIILKDDATPRFLKARSLPYAVREKVDTELIKMEQDGVITKVETSEWASPLVVVPKPNGKVRITGDFKDTVNNQLHITQYPIAAPDDIFSSMSNCTVFSKLDGVNAYHQMELEEHCKKFLVINTHRGLYRYNVLPQGIASSPAIFQEFMDKVLHGIPNGNAYIDDTLLSSGTKQQHITLVRQVLQRMRQFNFKLSKEKCELARDEVIFLGHKISAAGVSTTTEKIKAILDIKPPNDITELRSFMGFVNFYGKFIPELASVSDPIYNLTRADVPWNWSPSCQQAFEEIKRLLTTAPTLAHFDPKTSIGLSADASSVGAGIILFHKYEDGSERPICYASKTFSETEKRYSQIEKEGLAIIFGIKKYYKYLCGRKFLLISDHRPLLKIFGPKTHLPVYVASRLHHWSVYLQQFQYDINYRKSADHGNADALSRIPAARDDKTMLMDDDESSLNQVTEDLCDMLPVTHKKIKHATARDVILSKVKLYINSGWPSQLKDEEKEDLQQYFIRREEICIVNDIILWGIRVVIPVKLRKQILEELHAMHTGIVKMKSIARLHVWWPGLDKQIEEMCKQCTPCQQKQPNPPSAPLHPWQFPERPWQRLHLDLAGPFLNKMWLVIVDAHSKWPEVFCTNGTTSQVIIQKMEEVFSRHGIPEQLVSDNGRQFVSEEFKQFCEAYNLKHALSSCYHPRSNGEAERFIRTFKEKMVHAELPIHRRLLQFLFRYRSTPHSTTGVSPAELLNGRKLRTRLDLVHPCVPTTVRSSQARQEACFNKNTKNREFIPGQNVWVMTYSKHDAKWTPGVILQVLGPVTFLVDADGRKMKRHADQLRHAQQADNNDPSSSPSGIIPEFAAASDARADWDEPSTTASRR